MAGSDQIRGFRCFYDPASTRFHSVVSLGREVCGWPSTVHGGLTAALVDETLGGLCVSLWKSGSLGMRLPGYTARLEMDYKKVRTGEEAAGGGERELNGAVWGGGGRTLQGGGGRSARARQ